MRGRRRRRAIRWTAGFAVVAVLGVAGGFVVLGTDVLAVREVAVVGNSQLGVDEVRRAAAVPLGTPLARLDTAAVARRVRALPPVDSVAVERAWPNKVTVRLTERAPVAFVPGRTGGVLLDRNGMAYRTVAARPTGVPVVKAGSTPARKAAATVAGELTPQLRVRLVAIEVPEKDRITLRLSKGLTVRWGGPERSDRKATVATALLSRKDATLIDVTSPEVVTVR